jgi:hypothetical protein
VSEQAATLSNLIARANAWIRRGWTQGAFYTTAGGSGLGHAELASPQGRERIRAVCAIGAMRVAFAELVGLKPTGGTAARPTYDETQILDHPLYREGMIVLGRAFHESELKRHLAVPEVLLDGTEGYEYTPREVEDAIIDVNDSGDATVEEAEIRAAFERALELAQGEGR